MHIPVSAIKINLTYPPNLLTGRGSEEPWQSSDAEVVLPLDLNIDRSRLVLVAREPNQRSLGISPQWDRPGPARHP